MRCTACDTALPLACRRRRRVAGRQTAVRCKESRVPGGVLKMVVSGHGEEAACRVVPINVIPISSRRKQQFAPGWHVF
jgi:hypothetical protein